MASSPPKKMEEAKRLLEMSYKAEVSSKQQMRWFEDGIELLTGYIADHPSSTLQRYAANLKMAYTRRLLHRLSNMGEADRETWLGQLVLLTIVKSEVTRAIEEEPSLRDGLNAFVGLWKEN